MLASGPLRAFLTLLSVVVAALPAGAQSTDSVFPFKVHEKKLANGLNIVVVPTDYPDIVALQIPVRVGARNEVEPGRSGFAHFFEHMMFRGTDRFPAEKYNDVMKEAGADSNAYTTADFTNYHTTFSKADLETVLMVEADRFANLKYEVAPFQTEARAVLGEYNKNYANPINKLLEVQRDHAFKRHTYKHTTMGFIADIERMPEMYDYSRTFFDRFYRPERTTLIIGGDVDPQNVFALVEKHWGSWKRGGHTSEIAVEPPPTGAIYHHIPWSSPTPTWVTVGFRGPAASDEKPDMAAMNLISGLAFGQSSPLYRQLVIEGQKVDQLFAYFPDSRDPYLLTVMARVKRKEDAWAVRTAIQETFRKLRDERLPADRVTAVKSRLRYSFANDLDNSESIVEALVPYVALYDDWSAINRVYGLYAKLDADALQATARKWFTERGMIIVTLDDDELPKPDAGAGSFGGGEFTSSFHVLSKTNSPLVDFRIVVDHGSSMDTARTAGLANLTAAMVADAGSRTMSYSEIQQALFPMAASFSYQVDKEMTVFIGRTHRDNLDAYWKIVSGQLLDPGWRLDDFKRVKAKIVNQIRVDLRTNNDEELGKEVLYERLYEGHRYGRLNLGHVRTLNALTLVDVKRFYASYIRGAPRLGLAGGFDDAFAKRAIEDLAERGYVEDFDVEIANAIPGGRSLTGPKQHRVTIVQKETRATALSFGFHTPVNRRHPDFAALWLARSWLGEHRSSNSHLFQRMREIRGMNYGDYAYVEYFPRGMSQFHPDANLCRRHQIFQVWIRPVPPEQAVYALRIAKYELDKLVKNGLTEEQFTATRSFLSKYLALLVKSQDRQLGYAIDDRWYGMKDYVGTMRERLAGLTLEKVNAAIRRHLTYDGLEIVFIAKDAEGLKAQLVSGAPSPITYDSKKPADILQEDKLIERYPLGLDQGAIHVVDVKTVFE